MKRILFIIPFLYGGGAERVTSILTSELARLDQDVHLLLFYRVKNEYFVDEKVIIHTLKENKQDYDCLSFFSKIRRLRKAIKNISPDIVIPFITHVGIMTTVATIGLKCSVIETIRSEPKSDTRNVIIKILRNLSILLSKRCIVQNERQKYYFPKWMHKKFIVLPNPVSNDLIQVSRVFKRNEINTIIAVGRLEVSKNYPLLIKAFSKIEEPIIKLNIFGEGTLKRELQNMIDRLALDDRVKLCGRTSNIKEQLLKSDLYVLSSNYEGMPNALMEAMAVGLPCITTNCPTGPNELIDNYVNGILVPVDDEEKLINAINYMIKNPEYAFSMGLKAQEKIRLNYKADLIAKKLLDLINSI